MALLLRTAAAAVALVLVAGCGSQSAVASPSPSVAASASDPDGSTDASSSTSIPGEETTAAIDVAMTQVMEEWPDAFLGYRWDRGGSPGSPGESPEEELLQVLASDELARVEVLGIACDDIGPALATHGLPDLNFVIFSGAEDEVTFISSEFCDN